MSVKATLGRLKGQFFAEHKRKEPFLYGTALLEIT